ncbi:MAG: hypothetical protein AB8G11_08780 [Saprospiraceae bacterium]
MKKILVTGFMPFGGSKTNASWAVAQRTATQGSEYGNIVCEEIQVLWHDSYVEQKDGSTKWYKSTLNYIKDVVEKHNPDCLICVGEADQFRLECVGRNEAIAADDNAGKTYVKDQRGTIPLHEGKPYRLYATFINQIGFFIQEYNNYRSGDNEKLLFSDDAQGYLCNLALYESLNNFSDSIPHIGFIHTMNTEKSINGAVTVIQMIVEKLYKNNQPQPVM